MEHGEALQAAAHAPQETQSLGAVEPHGGQRGQVLESGQVGLGVPLEHQPFYTGAPGDGVADVRPRPARRSGGLAGLRETVIAHGKVSGADLDMLHLTDDVEEVVSITVVRDDGGSSPCWSCW